MSRRSPNKDRLLMYPTGGRMRLRRAIGRQARPVAEVFGLAHIAMKRWPYTPGASAAGARA